MSEKPCLNCGQPHNHDGIYCISCRDGDSDPTSDEMDTEEGDEVKQVFRQRDNGDAEYQELEIPFDVYLQLSEVVESDVTYRDKEDFLLSAIRSELRQAQT